ncbi:MAG: zinc ribbon domain-containing protein [Thermoplasmata archaeon]|nr:zinc ribbon domain-containing protein [Thermoplasmata archaeon]
MYCAHCGAALPEGTNVCTSCGVASSTSVPGSPKANSSDPIDEVLQETKKAVRELASATAKLSKQVAAHADALAKDPSGTTRKGLDHLKRDIHSLVDDVSDALKKL